MKKFFCIINILLTLTIIIGSYFYILTDLIVIKALSSIGFVLLAFINIYYNIKKEKNLSKSSILLLFGLIFAMIGDITLYFNFIIGAAFFAIGHIFYFISQSTFIKLNKTDITIGFIIFICSGLFITFFPLLTFPSQIIKYVCLIYSLIISLMVGKGISNFMSKKNPATALLLFGSILFFFSDLMLVFDKFTNYGTIAGILCIATYYPAQCLIAHSTYYLKKL